MIRYGDETNYRLHYLGLQLAFEAVRQWWNVQVTFDWSHEMLFPDDFTNPSVLMIVSPGGQLLDAVVLDADGLDSEYVLEDSEKDEILVLIQEELTNLQHPNAIRTSKERAQDVSI
jgi:hypothetical protein